MIRTFAFAAVALLTTVALAAPKDDVVNAAKKLGDAANYSWKTSTDTPGGQGRAFATDGKTEKGGFTVLTWTRGDNTTEIVIKGNKGAVKTDGGWQAADANADAGQGQPNMGRFVARMVQSFKAPAAQAEELAGQTQDLKAEDGVYTGALSEAAVKSLMAFGGRGGGQAPEVANPKGSVKFWVKDGVLTKFQYQVQGKVTFRDQERDIDRTTTVEIKDVGSTKVEVPDEAKQKVG